MLPLCSYTPTISAKLPPSFSFAPPQPHRPSDPYIKFSTVVAEFASTPLATFNNAQHATSTTSTRPKLVFGPTFAMLLLVAPLFSALHHYFSTPASSPLPSPQRRQVKFDISPSGEQGSNPTHYLQLKRDFSHTSNSKFDFSRSRERGYVFNFALAWTLISVQRRLNPIAPIFQIFRVQLRRRVRSNNATPSQTRRNLNYTTR
ncbi:hypothetical protein C8R43DRAFT_950746 [Mycena crocata]|nr:hypothetical protein C8R43DRAFT_950746 [Mycena crocata]